jgi:hypothetical protein
MEDPLAIVLRRQSTQDRRPLRRLRRLAHLLEELGQVSETRIYRIEEGSLVVVPYFLDLDQLEDLRSELERVAGHDRFLLVLEPPDGTVEVVGPADIIKDLEARGVLQDS